ncbi:hypothetical protein FQN57_004079 [Myotisia sp. PD_48]|nr:hypothetical protein FQN57_004079 [Myotisia sp. PD_48]
MALDQRDLDMLNDYLANTSEASYLEAMRQPGFPPSPPWLQIPEQGPPPSFQDLEMEQNTSPVGPSFQDSHPHSRRASQSQHAPDPQFPADPNRPSALSGPQETPGFAQNVPSAYPGYPNTNPVIHGFSPTAHPTRYFERIYPPGPARSPNSQLFGASNPTSQTAQTEAGQGQGEIGRPMSSNVDQLPLTALTDFHQPRQHNPYGPVYGIPHNSSRFTSYTSQMQTGLFNPSNSSQNASPSPVAPGMASAFSRLPPTTRNFFEASASAHYPRQHQQRPSEATIPENANQPNPNANVPTFPFPNTNSSNNTNAVTQGSNGIDYDSSTRRVRPRLSRAVPPTPHHSRPNSISNAGPASAELGDTGANDPTRMSHAARADVIGRVLSLDHQARLLMMRQEVHRRSGAAEKDTTPKGLDGKDDGRPAPKESEELMINMECKVCMSQLVDTGWFYKSPEFHGGMSNV